MEMVLQVNRLLIFIKTISFRVPPNKMSATKRIIKNSIMMYSMMFLSMFMGIFTSRVVLTVLGVKDFGIYSLIGGLVILFTFLNGSMAGSIQRFLSASLGKNDIQGTTEYFNASIIVHIIIAMLVIVFGKTIGEWVLLNRLTIPDGRESAAYWVLQSILMAFAFQIVSTPAQAMLTAYEKMGTLSLITFLTPLGRLISIIVARQLQQHDALITFSISIACFSLLQLLLFYGIAKSKCMACKFVITKDKKKFKDLTSFASWGLFGDIAGVLKMQGTSILLNLFSGTVANASYGVANQLASNFRNLSTMVTRAANPQIIKNYTGGNIPHATKLVNQLSRISFTILMLVSLPFFLETEYILKLWLETVPFYAVLFTKLFLVVTLIEVISIPLMTLARATGNIKLYQSIIGGIQLLTIPVAYILYKIGCRVEIIFYVHMIIAIIALLGRLILLQKIAHLPLINFLKQTFLRIIALIFIAFIFSLFTNYINSNSEFIRLIRIFFLPLTILTLSYFIMLNKNERKMLKGMIYRHG